ncbi:24932_t:CDS:2, partial [Gigaspora rosea]
NSMVALKSIKKCDKQSDFLNELKRYDVEKYGIETYGISYDPEKNRYMIIFDYA